MKHFMTCVLALGTLTLLVGCGQTTNTTHQKSSQTQSSKKVATRAKQASTSSSKPITATFKNQAFTTQHVTFKITGQQVTASSTANRQLFVFYYTVTNQQGKSIVPSDLWESAVSATQDGRSLSTGNLAFTTDQTQDNNRLNRTVMPLDSGKSVTGLATFEPKNQDSITVAFKDSNGHTVHQSRYPMS
ncbi:DUF5067 domain-containing protein [Levilactobacillus huananensis]|uniref:DUF5067 domain-containing protein n=1 Tax=Levilactobacillus huananensis TaxID=2486019 RepID=UPI001CDC5BBB|nr:DUF5067 domain-containing protein [Levilactobacillus huananensis]